MRKVFPTFGELEAFGGDRVMNAGQFVISQRDSVPEPYYSMVRSRSRPWGTEPPQPFHHCLEHLCTLLIVTCQLGTETRNSNTKWRDCDGEVLSEKQINAFIKISKARGSS